MTRETLFEAITNVKDELVDEAAQVKPAKKRVSWLKFGAAAAAAAVVVGLGAGVLNTGLNHSSHGWGPPATIDNINAPGSGGGAGHEEGTVFMSYAGPVFPLTAQGGEGLTARREVTYDFAGWDGLNWPYQVPVTDGYTLDNPTGEDKTITLLYPFVSSLYSLPEDTPELRVDGARAEAALRAGGYAGGFQTVPGGESAGLLNLKRFQSWEQYRDLLADGRYLEGALGDGWDLSHIPVVVYEFTDYWGPEPNSAAGIPNPTIRAEFDLDYSRTTLLSYGFHGASIDPESGHMMQSFSIPRDFEEQNPFYLFVVGEDISNLTTRGYATGGADTKQTVEAGVEVTRYTSDLESALRMAGELMYRGCPQWEGLDESQRPDFALYFGLLKEDVAQYGVIADHPIERYDTGWLQEMDFDAKERVFYLEAQVTVPAGGSVTVEAAMDKSASFDHYCAHTENQGIYGYDLTTRLGSSLDFTGQTARAVNTDGLEIVRQNFGFDWERGVDTVELDMAVEHYYLEVRRVEAE